MGRAVAIPPLDMTPEELAQALLRPIKPVRGVSGSSEKQSSDTAIDGECQRKEVER